MIITTLHETIFAYDQPVKFTFTETRLRPVSDHEQTCHEFAISVDPARQLTEAIDFFGNQVHTFNVMLPHHTQVVTTHSIVDTHRNPFEPKPALDEFAVRKAHHEFTGFGGAVEESEAVHDLADGCGLFESADRFAAAQTLNRTIFEDFEFDAAVTNVNSPISDVLAKRRGVCQDFAHLFIAACRAAGIPARYVSGYLVTRHSLSASGSPASHAWAEALLPEHGWCGFDPTNDLLANDNYVKVAVGRDYRDVAPTRGLYSGAGRGSLHVRVMMQIDGDSVARAGAEPVSVARFG